MKIPMITLAATLSVEGCSSAEMMLRSVLMTRCDLEGSIYNWTNRPSRASRLAFFRHRLPERPQFGTFNFPELPHLSGHS